MPREEVVPLVKKYAVRSFALMEKPEFKAVLKAVWESPELVSWVLVNHQDRIDALARDVLLDDKDLSIAKRYEIPVNLVRRFKQSFQHEIAQQYKAANADILHRVYEFIETGSDPLDIAIRKCIEEGKYEKLPKLYEQRIKFAELQARFIKVLEPNQVHNHSNTTYNQQLNVNPNANVPVLPVGVPQFLINLPQAVETPQEVLDKVDRLIEGDGEDV